MEKHILDKVDFYEENGCYYARMQYILEDDSEIKEVIIPKVYTGINRYHHPDISNTFCCERYPSERLLSLGGNNFRLEEGVGHDGANHVIYTVKVIEKKVKEVTMRDIEKKFGCKVKIVRE